MAYRLFHKHSNHTENVIVICDCIMTFLANSNLILQISYAKTFKTRFIQQEAKHDQEKISAEQK